jgi:hypothetical protein
LLLEVSQKEDTIEGRGGNDPPERNPSKENKMKTTKRTKKTPAPETTAPEVVETLVYDESTNPSNGWRAPEPAPSKRARKRAAKPEQATPPPETTATVDPAVSAPAPEAPAAEETPKTETEKTQTPKEAPLGKPRTAILAALAKNGAALSRSQIAEITGIKTGFTSLLGHVDPARREERSLAKLGLIEPVPSADGKSIGWAITTAGVAALAAATK